ncbi:MAG TPA: DoxX family protein [Longimicrobiaceae bacterium]|nr:DoxX family protein [Longimicrobiaceae bacterium]
MFDRLIRTDDNLPLFFVRLALAIVIWPHGAQKVLGWWHGSGPAKTIEFFDMAWGIPPFVTVLVMLAEFVGPVLLLAGLLGRFAAFSIALVMVGAIYFDTGKWGFFMNWYGQPRGEGFEFHILVFGMVAALLVGGSGRWSVDRMLTRRRPGTEAGYAPGRATGPETVGAR